MMTVEPVDYPLEERTIGRILADKANRIPDRPFLKYQGQVFTYLQCELMTNRYAHGLISQGVGFGSHVAVLLPNCPEFFWTVWGLGKIGAVGVPINTAAKGQMLEYFLNHSDATTFIFDDEFLDNVKAISTNIPKLEKIFYRGNKSIEETGLQTSNRTVQKIDVLKVLNTEALPLDRVGYDDIHLMMYTSGTTGPSKGVLSPHSQGHAVGRSLARSFGYKSKDILFTCLPLFHGNALWYTCYAALWAGAAIALSPRFSASRFWDEIRSSEATQFNTLGAMTNIIWQIPPEPQDRDHQLRQCMTVPVPKEIYQEMRHRYGVELTSVYAMTENFAMTRFSPNDPAEKAGSAGKPGEDSVLCIVDDEQNVLGPMQVGEIWMKPLEPGSMMKGYYKMPEQTAREFCDGWFKTGDRGYLDHDNYLFFVDRKKEAIRRRGENISAYEVELILSRHPAVLEVAAIPLNSELSEDDVMVFVVLKPDQMLKHAELLTFAVEHMSYFMVPRFIHFVNDLPKTASAKVEKYKLIKEANAMRSELWDREKEGFIVKR